MEAPKTTDSMATYFSGQNSISTTSLPSVALNLSFGKSKLVVRKRFSNNMLTQSVATSWSTTSLAMHALLTHKLF